MTTRPLFYFRAMNDIVDIARVIGHKQGEYAYYRAYYSLLKQLQDLMSEMSEDLQRLHESPHSNSSERLLAAFRLADHFRSSVQSISAQEKNARSALVGLCSADHPYIDASRLDMSNAERKEVRSSN